MLNLPTSGEGHQSSVHRIIAVGPGAGIRTDETNLRTAVIQALRAALDKNLADSSLDEYAATIENFVSYTRSIDLDSKMVVNPHRNYGNMPLIVLTASEYLSPPDFSAAAKAEIPQFHTEWERAHDAYAALSTWGVNLTVEGSSHDIPQIKPQAVIDAIDGVVSEARASVRTKRHTRAGAP